MSGILDGLIDVRGLNKEERKAIEVLVMGLLNGKSAERQRDYMGECSCNANTAENEHASFLCSDYQRGKRPLKP